MRQRGLVEVAFVDQAYTGEQTEQDAAELCAHGKDGGCGAKLRLDEPLSQTRQRL